MPTSLKRIRETGGVVFLHSCEVCGGDAPFGFGVTMRKALERLAVGDVVGAKRYLGRWFCREHKEEGQKL